MIHDPFNSVIISWSTVVVSEENIADFHSFMYSGIYTSINVQFHIALLNVSSK